MIVAEPAVQPRLPSAGAGVDWDILKRKLEKPYSRAYGLSAAQTLPLGSYGLCYCVGTVDCATHPSAGLPPGHYRWEEGGTVY